MPAIQFQDVSYSTEDGESVLDCLLRNGCEVPFSCKSGACQSCLMRTTEGEPDITAQDGLKATLVKQGYFLSCQCTPQEDMAVALPGIEDTTVAAHIKDVIPLCHNVKALLLSTQSPFECIPGQYLSLINPQGVIRSYSVANQPEKDNHIEVHIRLIPDGAMSSWVHNEASVGDKVHIRGPAGTCCYAGEEQKDAPMLLAGTGTGLAPLYGIVHDAFAYEHQGSIILIHGALKAEDLYYMDRLHELDEQHNNFTYLPCVLHDDRSGLFTVGNIEDVTLEHLHDPANTHVYLCGAPEFVNSMKKKVFLGGVASKNIYSDAFILSNA